MILNLMFFNGGFFLYDLYFQKISKRFYPLYSLRQAHASRNTNSSVYCFFDTLSYFFHLWCNVAPVPVSQNKGNLKITSAVYLLCVIKCNASDFCDQIGFHLGVRIVTCITGSIPPLIFLQSGIQLAEVRPIASSLPRPNVLRILLFDLHNGLLPVISL